MDKNFSEKILEYSVLFEPVEEGGYVVSVPTLSGCMTQGDTFEEAVKNVKDAIEGYLQVLKEEGESIPQEKQAIVITKVSVANPFISSL